MALWAFGQRHRAASRRRVEPCDTVFLYRTGHGIVAYGHATGRLDRLPHHDNPGEQYAMPLTAWRLVEPAMTAAQVKQATGVRHSFRGTTFSFDDDAGRALEHALQVAQRARDAPGRRGE